MLQPGNKTNIHRLFTILVDDLLDNLWAICGSAVDYRWSSRMVDSDQINMLKRVSLNPQFYPNL
jgi:hypothetical protein